MILDTWRCYARPAALGRTCGHENAGPKVYGPAPGGRSIEVCQSCGCTRVASELRRRAANVGQAALPLCVAVVACLHGCALLPDAIEPEVVHVSHATQHVIDHTDYGYNELALALKWHPTEHLTVEASEGWNLNRPWPNPYGKQYGSLIGPREVFEFRAGYEIPLRLK